MQLYSFSRRLTKAFATTLAAALVVSGALFAAAPAHAGDDKDKESTPRHTARPHMWWLQIYAHTMQEEAFLRWMDQTYGSPVWRHTMQEAQVNAMFAWWSKTNWSAGDLLGGSSGGSHP